MRALWFIFAALCSCGPCDDVLEQYCPAGRACWNDLDSPIPSMSAVGECAVGTVMCDKTGAPICVGTIQSSGEVCDGLDNDCDGEVDEHAVILDIPDCHDAFCGQCRPATVECVYGESACVPIFDPTDEVCDGLDNDCDCVVDNDIQPEFFYDGPAQTVGRGQCVPGVRYCEAGDLVEIPAVYPEPELCDGIDNDCDGFVDEADGWPSSYYLILDVSGSMSTYSIAAAQAFCDFARAAEPDTRFAVATVSSTDMPPYTEMRQDFADADSTCDTVNAPGFTTPFSGLEYMLEPFRYPTWPGADTVVIAITDEALVLFGSAGVDYAEATATCVSESFSVFVYTPDPFDSEWRAITDICGGDVLPLPSTVGAFREEFVAAFIGQCARQ